MWRATQRGIQYGRKFTVAPYTKNGKPTIASQPRRIRWRGRRRSSRARTASSFTRYSARSARALWIVLLEVVRRIDDGPRQADQIDLALREPTLLAELAHQLVAVELLDGVDEPALVDALDVDHLGLDTPLDRVGQGLDRLDRLSPVRLEIRRDRDDRPEGDEHAAAEGFPRVEVEPDGNHAQGARTLGLVAEGEPGGAGLDPLHAHLGVRRALGIDRDEPAFGEGLEARLEGVRVLVRCCSGGHKPASSGGWPAKGGWVVLFPIDGDRAARAQKSSDEAISEQRGGREVMNLAWDRAAHQERVDEVVGMVDAKKHRPVGRHALRVSDVDGPEEEPEPEAPDGAHGAIEGIHRVGPRAGGDGRGHGMRAKPSISRRAVRYTVTRSAQAAPSRRRTAASIGSTPDGWPRRMSCVPSPAHSRTTVPSTRAATPRHIATVSATARWQLPIEITRVSRSTLSAACRTPSSAV